VRKTRRYLLIILFVAVAGIVAWLLLRPDPEPMYEGRPLSYWCYRYKRHSSPDSKLQKQTETAIRTIGTNAIPTLLHWLKASDSKFKLEIMDLAQKQNLVHVNFSDNSIQRVEAANGFECLGPIGKSAVPALVEIYNDNLSNGDYYFFLRGAAVQTLGYIHSMPEVSVPLLTKSLSDPIIGIRYASAISLGAFGNDAKPAVPELIKALSDSSFSVRDEAVSALKKIDPETAAKAGVK
jgi:HEAT repeat protein